MATLWRTVNMYLSSTAKVRRKTWPLPFAQLSVTGCFGLSSPPSAVNIVSPFGTVTPSPLQPKPAKYASLVPRGDSRRIAGESLAIVSLYLVSVRSSIRAPFKLIDPWRSAVRIGMRGVSRTTTASARTVPGSVAAGPVVAGSTLDLPSTIFVAGGLARGKEMRRQEIAPDQDERGQHREQHEIAGIFFHASKSVRLIRVQDRARTRPRGDTARFASSPTTRLSARHSGEVR